MNALQHDVESVLVVFGQPQRFVVFGKKDKLVW